MAAPQTSFRIGDVFARDYRIDAQIGAGGFGVVYRATRRGFDRPVALKILLPQLLGPEGAVGRFRREAELVQRLSHPNVVRLYDHGLSDEGLPYLAFELLNGKPLSDLLLAGPLPAARVGRIGAQILKALMDAHAQGIVHRDLKPSNIFLCEFSGETDFVKVLDFGIAKVPNAGGQTTALTQTGEVIGSPSYMAPEQVLGGEIGPRTDLYALGLLLGEALAGSVLVTGPSSIAVCMAQAVPTPVALPLAVLASPLGPVVQRAVDKRPEARPGSAAEMLRELESAMAVAPPPPSAVAAQTGPALRPEQAQASQAAFVTGPSQVSQAAIVVAPPQSYQPAPAYQPPPPAYHAPPAPPPEAPARSSAGIWIALGGGVLLLALASTIVLVLLLHRDDGDAPSSATQPTTLAPVAQPPAPQPQGGARNRPPATPAGPAPAVPNPGPVTTPATPPPSPPPKVNVPKTTPPPSPPPSPPPKPPPQPASPQGA